MSQDLTAQVATLSAKVELLEKERAILGTLYRYGHSIDYGLEDDWVDCFTSDGVYDLHFRVGGAEYAKGRTYGEQHDKGLKMAGRDGLKAFISNHTRAPMAWHKHFLVEPVIAIAKDGKSASVQSYFTRLDEQDGDRIIKSIGRYLDKLTLCPDGVWRFTERVCEIESVAPKK